MCGLEFVGIWALFGIVSAVVASRRGRTGCGWFALGFLLGPFGLILAFVATPDQSRIDDAKLETGTMKRCPSCAEVIRQEATKCRFCGESVGNLRHVSGAAEAWHCPKCGTTNSSRLYKCGKCGYAIV